MLQHILVNFLTWNSPPRSLRLSKQDKLVYYKTSTSFGDRAFQNYAPRLWNDLSGSIRSINSESNFERHLETHMFNM